jgi:Rrf2 family protein
VGNVELSSRVQYALLALLELASHHPKDSPLTVTELTASGEIPERYLDQILAVLRGAKGGYLLAKEPWQITLLEVFSTLEGSGSGQTKKVSESVTIEKTVVLEIWQEARQASFAVLGKYTLQDLCEQRDIRKQTHPMYYI